MGSSEETVKRACAALPASATASVTRDRGIVTLRRTLKDGLDSCTLLIRLVDAGTGHVEVTCQDALMGSGATPELLLSESR
jgi:hypothetical protein